MKLTAENSFAKEVIEQVKRRTFDSFTMAEMNLITYGLMRMKHRDPEFLKDAAGQFARNAAELMDIEIVNAVYAFAQLDFVHLQFVHAMLAEIRRRGLINEMDPLQISTLVYSLGISHVVDEDFLDEAAAYTCRRIRDFAPQSLAMLLHGMAVLNGTKHAEPLVSACLEELATRPTEFEPLTASLIFWSSSILSGATSALWGLEAMFSTGFWSQSFVEKQYAMIYHFLAALRSEAGIVVEDLEGWWICRRLYEESTSNGSMQNQRLAERLAMQMIPHVPNSMVPAVGGNREAGMRGDIVIEKLNLIIEVEGPQRMTIPLDKTMAELPLDKTMDGEDGEDSAVFGDDEVCGTAEDVVGQVRVAVECGLTGSASFKRRLLRKAGWRVVTVSFDENEEYIADALGTMTKKGNESDEEAESAGSEARAPASAPTGPSGPTGGEVTFTDEDVVREDNWSDYEKRLREQHAIALKELRRRILEERGNAAASAAYSNHLEYRRWQVGLEKQVLKEMVAAL